MLISAFILCNLNRVVRFDKVSNNIETSSIDDDDGLFIVRKGNVISDRVTSALFIRPCTEIDGIENWL